MGLEKNAPMERRTAPRARFDTPVLVYLADRETSWVGHDVSETGLGITSPFPARAECGQRVRVRFALPRQFLGLNGTTLLRWIEGGASVVRRGPGELGLRLDDIREVDRRAIRTYVFTGSAEIRDYAPAPLP